MSSPDRAAPSFARALLVYTLLRLLLLAVVTVALLAVGVRGIVAVAIALLISSLLALVLLPRWRDDLALAMTARAERKQAEHARLRAKLDAPPSDGVHDAPHR